MTNEKKVIELIGCEGRRNCLECGGSLSVENGCSMFRKMMAMAQWKDEQFAKERQALIDNACEWLKENFNVTLDSFKCGTIERVLFTPEIEERFRKSMEETK